MISRKKYLVRKYLGKNIPPPPPQQSNGRPLRKLDKTKL